MFPGWGKRHVCKDFKTPIGLWSQFQELTLRSLKELKDPVSHSGDVAWTGGDVRRHPLNNKCYIRAALLRKPKQLARKALGSLKILGKISPLWVFGLSFLQQLAGAYNTTIPLSENPFRASISSMYACCSNAKPCP